MSSEFHDPAGYTGVVVVTGAAGGIGRAIASTLGSAGYAVIVHFHTNEPAARFLVEEISEHGGRAFMARADLADPAGVEELLSRVDEILGSHPDLHLWGLVNNAAAMLGPSFAEASPDEFDRYFALNTRAPFFLAQRLAERMTTGGSIVNISSAGAHFSSAGDIVYAMTKAALESLTRNAAEALAPRGVRINSVIPGFTDNGHPALSIPAVREHVGSYALLGGVASPTAVADAVAFLLSQHAARTTGAALDVTGGSLLGVRPTTAKISLRRMLTDESS